MKESGLNSTNIYQLLESDAINAKYNLRACRSKLFYLLLLLGITFSVSPLLAQLNPNNLTAYSEMMGTDANCVMVDHFGYVWIGTANGLVRYDGYEFKRYHYDPNDSTSIRGIVIRSLFEDRGGNIWIGCTENLSQYNPATKSFRQFEYNQVIGISENSGSEISTIVQDNLGRIYFGINSFFGVVFSHTLFYYDEVEDQLKLFEYPDSLNLQNIRNSTVDQLGNVWLSSYSGLFKINKERKLFKIQLPVSIVDSEILGVTCDSKNTIWFTTNQSILYSFNPQNGLYKSYSYLGLLGAKNQFLIEGSITVDTSNNIWLSSYQGLLFFDSKKERFEHFPITTDNNIARTLIYNLDFDSIGTLWIGAASNGLLKYENKPILQSYTFNKENKTALVDGWVGNIYESNDGKIWMTTSGSNDQNSGISIWDPTTGSMTNMLYKSILPGIHEVLGIIENSPGEFYISTRLGLYQFYSKSNTSKKIVFSGVSEALGILYFYKDSKENLWLCTNNGLFKRKTNSDSFIGYRLDSLEGGNTSSNYIIRAFESSINGLWILTGNGLFLYDYKTDKIERHGYDQEKGDVFVSQVINSFYEDSQGSAWVGTWQGGLSRYDIKTRKIKTYSRNDGLPSMSIQGILGDDPNKAIWLSTFDGMSRLNLDTEQFNNFSLSDGTQSQLYTGGSYLKTSTGLFIFGGSNGINAFNPGDFVKTSIPPRVFLTDFKIDNISVAFDTNAVFKDAIFNTSEIQLAYNQNTIAIDYVAIHYTNPTKNKYACYLENYEDNWRDVGTQRTAYYSNLPPGEYIFRVKAANSNGIWNETGVSLKIIIKPPWYKTDWAYTLYILLIGSSIWIFTSYRSRRLKQENIVLEGKVSQRTVQLNQSLENLKATQAQLIQSEKMASLGELTAGIAHEIQNPLNFVNNFSEVNKELIDEMEQEVNKGNLDEVKSIAKDIRENEEKINHHGKRADAIVKGMLQHSRTSSGIKEPTDINALCDEYLRLAYHGLRAKDKTFNATMKTDFDPTIGKINVIPQDIGRVVLNLITNAFYAVSTPFPTSTSSAHRLTGGIDYEPTVSISTKNISLPHPHPDSHRIGGRGSVGSVDSMPSIEITVKDNGPGIPQHLLDKIFQPFFTTKPTGQGTGLGLSLSYDIVKAHGGEISVNTNEAKGTEFIIVLPIV